MTKKGGKGSIKRIKKLLHNQVFWLILITVAAIIIRSIPAWTNAAWGCDFGIYYGLTQSYVQKGEIITNCNPWWSGPYQYFPMLYIIAGTTSKLTGIDPLIILPKLVPIIGSLSVLVFYFVTKNLLHEKKIALLSSLLFAVLPFHAYQTSQAAPLTIGHFFLMLSLYFFIKTRENKKYMMPLILSTSLLIMTHHFTTYIYLISLIFIIFMENILKEKWTFTIKRDLFYILVASFLTFGYWAFIAKPVFENFMKIGLKIGTIPVGQYGTIALFYLVLVLMMSVILLKRKLNVSYHRINLEVPSRPLFPFILATSIFVMALLSFLNLPWGKIYFTLNSALLLLPFFIVLSFGIVGLRRLISIQNGPFICGWFLVIVLSMFYGFVSLNRIILPYRHLEYLMAPLSILAVYGFLEMVRFNFSSFAILSLRKIHLKKTRIVFPVLILILITTNGISVYPSYLALEKLDKSYETITYEDLAAMDWINENLDKNTTVIASDHRLSLIADAYSFNTTEDKTLFIWNSSDLKEYIDELYGNIYYDKITHVVIDDIMKEGVVHIGFNGIKVYMTNETWTGGYDKFSKQPFELVYRNESAEINPRTGEPLHWAEVYRVNWTYLEKFTNH